MNTRFTYHAAVGSLSETARHRPKVLLVEDGAISQVLATETLRALACDVVIVTDGEAAVERSRHEPFDLILMDCELPGIDGLEATRQIRDNSQALAAAGAPIIALTGNDENDYRQRCLAAGMTGFLTKPVNLKTLGQVLQNHLPNYGAVPPSIDPFSVTLQAPPHHSAPPVIDREALASIRALERPDAPNLVTKVINHFFQHTAKLMRDLEQGWPAGDASAIKDAAHSLKSLAATVGALALAARAKELEQLAHQGDLTTTGDFWQRLHADYEQARSALSLESRESQR